jgi:hypothetical protein
VTALPLLLADPSACLRWLVLRQLFGRPPDDPELAEGGAPREHDPAVADLLARQAADGSWPAAGQGASRRLGGGLLETAFALARLGYCGFDGSHPAVRRAAGYLFGRQRKDGAWPLAGGAALTDAGSEAPANERYSMIPLQTAFPLRGLAACGYATDSRAERAYDWLLAQRLDDGAWPTGLAAGVFGFVAGYRHLPGSRWGCRSNTTGALLCLAHHPTRRASQPAQRALDLLLGHEAREAASLGLEVARLAGAEPPRGFFTYFARPDAALLLHLGSCVGLSKNEPRVAGLIEFARSLQGPYGLWDPPAWPQAARWISFDVLCSLRRLGVE